MFGDIYSTLTLAGSYANAMRAAQESEMQARRQHSELPRKQIEPQDQKPFIKRLIMRLGNWFRAPSDELDLSHVGRAKQSSIS
jgi:hypothetical protein